jgi:hypothetical protein
MLRTAMGRLRAGWTIRPSSRSNPGGRLWIDRLAGGLSDTGKGPSAQAQDGERFVRVVAQHVDAEVHPGGRASRFLTCSCSISPNTVTSRTTSPTSCHGRLLVAESIVLNKDGSFQRTVHFRVPDLESAMPAELVGVKEE